MALKKGFTYGHPYTRRCIFRFTKTEVKQKAVMCSTAKVLVVHPIREFSHLIMGPFKVPVVAQEALAWQWGG